MTWKVPVVGWLGEEGEVGLLPLALTSLALCPGLTSDAMS